MAKDRLNKDSVRSRYNYAANTCIKEVQKITWHSPGNNLGGDTVNSDMKRRNGNRKIQSSMSFM